MPFVFFILFLLWVVVQALFISPETAWAIKEILGQWGNGILSLAIGATLAISSEKSAILSKKNIFSVLFWTLVVHIFYIDLSAIVISVKTGRVPLILAGLTGGHEKISYLSIYLFVVLAADIFFRAVYKKKLIEVGNFILICVMVLTLSSIYFEAARNGTIVVVLVSAVIVTLLFREKKLFVILVVIAVISFLTYIAIKTDQRWKTVSETGALALDSQGSKAWRDSREYPFPKLQDGKPLDNSTYQRLAWLKEGVVLAVENPLGIGFGRSAFGHAIKRKYGGTDGAHSHSGILDLAIGTGIPGLLLWAGFMVSLMVMSFRQFNKYKSCSAFLFFFIVLSFSLRTVVDSIIRDHMLQQFMFLVGLLYIFTISEKNETGGKSCSKAYY